MRYGTIVLVAVLFSVMMTAIAQDECSALVEDALAIVDEACEGIGRNQACYGHTQVAVSTFADAEIPPFEGSGDIINIENVASLQTAPLSLEDNVWGVALLSVQADLPDTLPGQNVTIVLFGDTEITNDVAPLDAGGTLEGVATGNVNIRSGPGTNFTVVSSLTANDPVTIVGRNAASDWVQIELDNATLAWVFASLLTLEGDLAELPLRESNFTAPMQAFRFSSGIGETPCEALPRDGLLIQAPEETVVHFSLNGIEVEIGSAAVVRNVEDTLTISTLQGLVEVASAGVSRSVEPGFQTQVEVGQAPSQAAAYTIDDVRNIPVNLLPDPVDVPPPAGTNIGIFPCYAGGGQTDAPGDSPFILRFGWAAQTPETLADFVNNASFDLTVDGESYPLWSRVGPTERSTQNGYSYVMNWYWVVDAEPGSHPVNLTVTLAAPVSDGENVTSSLEPMNCTVNVAG